MTYILLIISGILAYSGVLFETHVEVERNKRKVKVLSRWGIITVIALSISFTLTIYKEILDSKQQKLTTEENNYLKLSTLTIGPYYQIKVFFSEDMFLEDWEEKQAEANAVKQVQISNLKNLNLSDTSLKQFES